MRRKFAGRAALCGTLMALAAYNDEAMQSSAAPDPGAPNAYVTLASATYSAPADSASVLISVTLNGALAGERIAASYATTNGSAVAGVDYLPMAGTLTWEEGDAPTKTIAVPIDVSAGGKQFGLQLTSVTAGAALRPPASAVVDVTPVPTSGMTQTDN
jgi:Calx-beta domain-containing protein